MERIGHYKIVSELGRGGMGVVYKAHEESLNRFVAIKVLGEHLEGETEYVERFLREARSAAALSHPNIVQIYAIDEEAGHHYFVMEYVQGTNVQRMIQTQGKIPPANAVRLLLQAAAGLEDAHAQGVIHRDIKPANLMVTDRGLVKIADFGLALMGGVTTRLTATGMLMGTPGYLSPEQCLDQQVDHRTDIYSLGVTFFEMLTGTMPFRADSPLALLKLIVEVEPPDVRDLNPEVDETLRDIVSRMLAKNRDERTSSCGELVTSLENWLDAHGERPYSATSRAGSEAAARPAPPPALDEDLNTQPTVAVPSGAGEQPGSSSAPPPPPVAGPGPVPVTAGTVPAPHATAPASQPAPSRHSRSPVLIVAVVVVFLLATTTVAAVLVVKSGILSRVFARERGPVAEMVADDIEEPVAGPGTTAGSTPDGDLAEAAPAVGDVSERADESAHAEAEGVAASDGDTRAPAADENHAGAVHDPSAVARRTAVSGPGVADHGATASGVNSMAQAPTEVLPPATATVVIAVGERLLAGEAETYIKGRLAAAGVELVEITSIPGFEAQFNPEQRPAPEEIRTALRPFARYLVPVRIEYLGERPITYMGQRDVVYQARVSIGLMDLAEGHIIGRPRVETFEYTQLNAERIASEKLRRPVTALLQVLPRR